LGYITYTTIEFSMGGCPLRGLPALSACLALPVDKVVDNFVENRGGLALPTAHLNP